MVDEQVADSGVEQPGPGSSGSGPSGSGSSGAGGAATPSDQQVSGDSTRAKIAGGLAALAMPAIVYSQFNIHAPLSRDESIYLYGGQRVIHGVPPYASIMDPKGPINGILAGIGVGIARLFGRDDVITSRALFGALAIVSVLGVYLLVVELWHSAVAGVVAAAAFTAFRMYAHDALSAPEGHGPGVVFAIFALWLIARRRWYWAGVLASLAFFTWQPLFGFALVGLLCAAVWSPGRRWRNLGRNVAGALTPFVALIIYYAASGYPGKLFEGALLFPLTGVSRPPRTLGNRIGFIVRTIDAWYGASAILLWVGLILMLVGVGATLLSRRRAALTSPLVLLIFVSFLIQLAYLLYDYIGWPHAFTLLPYAAVGVGGTAAYLLRALSGRVQLVRVATAALVAAVVAVTALSAVSYYVPTNDTALLGQRASSCALQRSLAPDTKLWVIDNPRPLVLLHRVNPDSYAYVGSGLARWRVEHVAGGFDEWTSQIRATASIVVLQDWVENVPLKPRLRNWLLAHGYRHGFIGQWQVYVTAAARTRMAARQIALSERLHQFPLSTGGTELRSTVCAGRPA